MILRIEDTDQNRYVDGAEEYIMDSLEWCGIRFDEGVREGGEYGPYRQSERKAIYKKYALKLYDAGFAYYAFDTPEELDDLRKRYEAGKKLFTYDASTRMQLKNSLTLPEEEVWQRIDNEEPYVIRFRMPEEGEILEFDDLIRGRIQVDTATLDDKVLFKSDGMPTYHLANIVDDHLMEITHVIRGEEWLPSLPLHVMMYRSLGWRPPAFAHLPLILKPEGSGKLSKRDGDRLGFPVFPLQWQDPESGDISSGYREEGYFPEAFINMLALLGWNPGTEKEVFTMEELIGAFSMERVGRSGSRFDPEKARWFNHQWLMRRSDQEIAKLFLKELDFHGIVADPLMVGKVVRIVKERADFVKDLWDQSFFFFVPPVEYDEKAINKKWKDHTGGLLEGALKALDDLQDFKADDIKEALDRFAGEKEVGLGQVMIPLRISLVGGTFGPDLPVICEMLGRDEVVARVKKAVTRFS